MAEAVDEIYAASDAPVKTAEDVMRGVPPA